METFEAGIDEIVRAGSSGGSDATARARARIDDLDPHLNAFVETRPPSSSGSASGPLAGVPVAIKDMFVDRDRAPTVGSRVHGTGMSGTAEVIRRLEAAGASIVGYTNLHEWAIGSTSAVTATGPIRNPIDVAHMAGGSSGGSAVAVASGMACAAVGTDAGGSVRVPSACCGVVGLKPTWGAVPVEGWVEGVSAIDHIGPIARSVGDVRTMFSVMSARSVDEPSVRDVRIGFARNLFATSGPSIVATIYSAVDLLGPHVARIREVEVSDAELASYAIGMLLLPHTARLVARALRDEPSSFEPITLRLLQVGRAIADVGEGCDTSHHRLIVEMRKALPKSFLQFPRMPKTAQRRIGKHIFNEGQGRIARARAERGWAKAFDEVDVVVSPTLPGPPPRLDDLRFDLPSGKVASDEALLPLLGSMNLAGLPSLSVPCGENDGGWPVSLCLTAARGRDDLVLAVGEKLEAALEGRYANRVITPA